MKKERRMLKIVGILNLIATIVCAHGVGRHFDWLGVACTLLCAAAAYMNLVVLMADTYKTTIDFKYRKYGHGKSERIKFINDDRTTDLN